MAMFKGLGVEGLGLVTSTSQTSELVPNRTSGCQKEDANEQDRHAKICEILLAGSLFGPIGSTG